jgi:hypothetical protein
MFFIHENKKVLVRNRLNFYGFLIVELRQLVDLSEYDMNARGLLVEDLKIAFENFLKSHNNLGPLIKNYLANYEHTIFDKFKAAFIYLITKKRASTQIKDLECEFARRFKFEISIETLLNPSKYMCDVIKTLSVEIISILKNISELYFLKEFLLGLGPDPSDLNSPSISTVGPV